MKLSFALFIIDIRMFVVVVFASSSSTTTTEQRKVNEKKRKFREKNFFVEIYYIRFLFFLRHFIF